MTSKPAISTSQIYFRPHHRLLWVLPVFAVLLLMSVILSVANAVPLTPVFDQESAVPLPLTGRVPGDGFGRDVVIDGNTALIGAGNGVYVYVRGGTMWTQQAKLQASNGVPLTVGDIDGDTALARGPIDNSSTISKAIYVFTRSGTTWTQQAKLITDRDYIVFFPTSVRIDGDLIIAGAIKIGSNPDKPVFYSYGFVRTGTTWSEAMEIPLSATLDNDVALSGDTAILYNNRNIGSGEPNGWIYVYRYISGVWQGTGSLSSGDADPGIPDLVGNFYTHVDLSGDTLVSTGEVYTYDTYEEYYRVVFVFTRSGDTWTRQAMIVPLNNQGHHYDIYPEAITIDGDLLAINVVDPDNGARSELIYARSGGTWALEANIPASQSDFRRIALSGDTLLLGVQEPDAATYVYVRSAGTVRSAATWSLQAKLTLGGDPNELLANGGFESVISGNTVVGNWKLKGFWVGRDNASVHTGNAALKFMGSTEKAIQNVDLTRFALKAGDKIRLTGFYHKLSTQSYAADIWLYISYTNLPDDQAHITVQKPTAGWQSLPRLSAVLKAKPTRVRVVIQAVATDQQVIYFDDMSLKLVTPALKGKQAPELLPLP